MALNITGDSPLGVFKRVTGSNVEAPEVHFITKNQTSFGNAPARDVSFEWDKLSVEKLSVLVRNTHARINTWKISNQNATEFFVNEKLLKTGDTLTLMSGDKFQFVSKNNNLNLTYSFHLYTEDNPASHAESKNYLETKMQKLKAEVTKIKLTCAKLIAKLNGFERDPGVKNAFADCGKPIGSIKQITRNVRAPRLYFVEKPNVSIGRDTICDVIIDSEVCSWREVLLKQENLQWKIINESPTHLHSINKRGFVNGEVFRIKSKDTIHLGGTDIIYQFKLYSKDVPLWDMKAYVEFSLKTFQKEAEKLNEHLGEVKLELDKLNAIKKNEAEKETITKICGDNNETQMESEDECKKLTTLDRKKRNKAQKTEVKKSRQESDSDSLDSDSDSLDSDSDSNPKPKTFYPMIRNPVGRCVIFRDKLEQKKEVFVDGETLKSLFEKRNFVVEIYKDLETLDIIANADHSEYDIFLCFILMHKDKVGAKKYGCEEILDKFNETACPSLAKKPKVFFIDSAYVLLNVPPIHPMDLNFAVFTSLPTGYWACSKKFHKKFLKVVLKSFIECEHFESISIVMVALMKKKKFDLMDINEEIICRKVELGRRTSLEHSILFKRS